MNTERLWIQQLQQQWPQVDFRHDTFYDPDSRQIVTTDMLVEGVHFSWAYCQPADVGWRSVAVNLSDIAATGGQPQWVLVSVGIPEHADTTLLSQIYQGIRECCQTFRCQLVGGDTVRSSQVTLSVTILGNLAPQSQPGRRHLAQPGDVVAVSGPHGLSRAGLEALKNHWEGFATAKSHHLRPMPQLKLGQRIAQVVPRMAMMDSSDGLADAALRLAEASQVDVMLGAQRVVVHPEVQAAAEKANAEPLDWVLYGGEDFQLVVCLPPEIVSLFPDLQTVGRIVPSQADGVHRAWLWRHGQAHELQQEKAFQHFSSSVHGVSGESQE